MARCGCSGASCSCLIVAGTGITVTGIGTTADPFVVSRDSATDSISGQIETNDSDSVVMTLLGAGTTADPLILKAELADGALDDKVGTDGTVLNAVRVTQAEYDALVPVATTLYLIA